MIKNFADKETEKIYKQIFSKKLPQSIQRIALRKLIMIDNAGCVEDLRVPPANHLELLKSARAGQYSIRINDQYRICFTVSGKDFLNVELLIIIRKELHYGEMYCNSYHWRNIAERVYGAYEYFGL